MANVTAFYNGPDDKPLSSQPGTFPTAGRWVSSWAASRGRTRMWISPGRARPCWRGTRCLLIIPTLSRRLTPSAAVPGPSSCTTIRWATSTGRAVSGLSGVSVWPDRVRQRPARACPSTTGCGSPPTWALAWSKPVPARCASLAVWPNGNLGPASLFLTAAVTWSPGRSCRSKSTVSATWACTWSRMCGCCTPWQMSIRLVRRPRADAFVDRQLPGSRPMGVQGLIPPAPLACAWPRPATTAFWPRRWFCCSSAAAGLRGP